MPYPVWTVGQRVTAAGLSSIPAQVAYKSADQTVTSSTTNVNDNHLALPVAGGSATYLFSGFILYSAHQDADIKCGFTVPSGANFNWSCYAALPAQTGGIATLGIIVDKQTSGATTFPLGGFGAENSSVMIANMTGVLSAAGTSGTLQFNWGQRVSHATGSIVRTASWIRLERIS